MIDSKKFLKKLSLFDILMLSLVGILIIIVAFFFFRQKEWAEVTIKVSPSDFYWSDKKPPFWLANNIQKGDYELDGLGTKVVDITNVRSFDGPNDKKTIFLTAKLQVIYDKTKKKYSFKSKPIAIGAPIELRLSQVFITGVITYVKGQPDTRIWEDKIVEAKLVNNQAIFPETQGVNPWIDDAIQLGDTMKDSQNEVIAEVVDKKSYPANKIVTTADGRVFIQKDPLKRDVTMTLRLKTYRQNDTSYYLDEFKVKIGTEILLNLSNIDLWPQVTRIIK